MPWLVKALRAAFLFGVALLLVTGIIGGLLRAGVAVPLPRNSAWPGQAVLAHAFLMTCGFLGTAIGIERAVAIKDRFAFAAPGASALAGLAMLAGLPSLAAWLAVAAAVAFIAVNVVVVERQRAPHTILLLTGAAAWLVGNLLQVLGTHSAAVIPWWFAFLILTIAAERLEMTRLMRRRPGAAETLYVCLGALLLSSATFALSPVWGGIAYGASLLGLAGWMIVFDIARRTITAHGLTRYMAICLLLGYGWLAVTGAGWVATYIRAPAQRCGSACARPRFHFFHDARARSCNPAGCDARQAALWPVTFYVPLAVLHVSLVVRLGFGQVDVDMLRLGAEGNALAIGLFIMTMAGSALAWRMQRPSAGSSPASVRH